jgi:hypothetical protein
MICRQAFTGCAEDCVSKPSPQYGSLAGGEHQRQFINEPLTLSPNDCAIILDFLRAVYNLHSIPSCHVPGLTRSKHPIQHATYGAYRLSAFLMKIGLVGCRD